MRLNPDTTLAYWQVSRYVRLLALQGLAHTIFATHSNLAIVALLPSETYMTRRGLIEYNLVFFKQGVQEILEVEAAERGRLPDKSPTSPK